MRSRPKITDEPASGPAPRRAEHPQDRALTTTEGGTREASTKWKGKNPCVAWEGVWADRRTNAATVVTRQRRATNLDGFLLAICLERLITGGQWYRAEAWGGGYSSCVAGLLGPGEKQKPHSSLRFILHRIGGLGGPDLNWGREASSKHQQPHQKKAQANTQLA